MLLRFDNDLEFDWYQISEIHEQRNTPPFEGDFEGSNTTKLSRSFADWLRMVSSAELLAKRRLVSPEDEQDESNAQPLPHVDGVAVDKGLNLNFITTGFSSFLDARVNPRRGARWALTWGNGGPLGFSGIQPQLAARHNWIELQSAYYYPLLKPLISAARLDGGRFFGTGGINSDRFFLGGPRNVRAFGFRELCPSEEFGQVCSGEDLVPAYYLASLEFRFTPLGFRQISEESPLSWFQPVQLVPFVDYGKVWNLREPFGQQPHGQGTAYGLGFRYPVFDIFQVRLDFAWGVTGAGNEAFAWIIDLAQAF
jgi:outer membrane protein assembly factor BamA